MGQYLLTINNLSIRAGGRALLADVRLNFEETGLYVVMGPVGVGKSTLLSILGGHGSGNGLEVASDISEYKNSDLGVDNHPIVIKQASRSEQAKRAIDGGTIRAEIDEALALDPLMLCLDEPTAGVAHSEALAMLTQLKEESTRRAIVMVTHNSEQARYFSDWVVLLGGGGVVEQGETAAFFDAPSNPVTKHFIKTGGLALPRLDAHPRQLAPEHRGLITDINTQTVGAPDGDLNWIIRRSFAIVHGDTLTEAGRNALITSLTDRNISVVVSFEDNTTAVQQALNVAGIKNLSIASPSENAPRGIQASLALAVQIGTEISAGRSVAVLENGQGQTGIMAAVQMIHMGITAKDAIDLLNAKSAGGGIHMRDEQFLWDLELVLDLASDNDQAGVNSLNPLATGTSPSNPTTDEGIDA